MRQTQFGEVLTGHQWSESKTPVRLRGVQTRRYPVDWDYGLDPVGTLIFF